MSMNTSMKRFVGIGLALIAGAFAGCSSYKASGGLSDAEQRRQLESRAEAAVEAFKDADASLGAFFDSASGYAVFPSVAKGGAGIGAARGRGVLYEEGEASGYATLTQGTVGLQLGGKTYRQIIFFKDRARVAQFKRGDLAFSAQASATAATTGAAANADYEEGVAVFTLAKGGLMAEASIGGQKFSYTAK